MRRYLYAKNSHHRGSHVDGGHDLLGECMGATDPGAESAAGSTGKDSANPGGKASANNCRKKSGYCDAQNPKRQN
jgi:hypothetical protein